MVGSARERQFREIVGNGMAVFIRKFTNVKSVYRSINETH